MTSNDLLDTVFRNRWRLDCRHQTGAYRVLYWCESCGLWRPVEDSGAFHAGPREAIEAAVAADPEVTAGGAGDSIET